MRKSVKSLFFNLNQAIPSLCEMKNAEVYIESYYKVLYFSFLSVDVFVFLCSFPLLRGKCVWGGGGGGY